MDKIPALSNKEKKKILICSFCDDYETKVIVPFGCFLDHNLGVSAYLMKERPGQVDILLRDIFCENCGCVSGLKLKD